MKEIRLEPYQGVQNSVIAILKRFLKNVLPEFLITYQMHWNVCVNQMATTLKVTALIIQKKYIYPTGQAKMIFTI
jgi:hypothetical protein